MVTINQVKELREATGISISECKKALEEAGGDFAKAKDLLREWGKDVAGKKQAREVGEGLVEGYIHPTGRTGAMVQVRCETDFVARSDDFKNLCHELALQVASMDAENVEELLGQAYIRDTGTTIKNLVEESVAKLGENIVVDRFVRFHL